VDIVPNIPATARQEIPTTSQNGNGFWEFASVAFGRMRIL
jgi:hypothetical protein